MRAMTAIIATAADFGLLAEGQTFPRSRNFLTTCVFYRPGGGVITAASVTATAHWQALCAQNAGGDAVARHRSLTYNFS